MATRVLMAVVSASLAVCGVQALAADTPSPGAHDPRVRYIDYNRDQVTVVTVRRGVATRIILEDGERIQAAASGFAADCQKAELEWCVRAEKDSNQVWVKPKDGATSNNLELATNKRDYSFEFRVLKDGGRRSQDGLEQEPMFRVMFRYPVVLPSASSFLASLAEPQPKARDERSVVEERLSDSRPAPRNWSYSMQVLPGGEEIRPSLVFDDGRFTYFRFAGARPVPSIFYVSPSGEEQRLNMTMIDDETAEVQRLGQRFVLRLGGAIVGVWNDAFDAEGRTSSTGTSVEGVTREIKR